MEQNKKPRNKPTYTWSVNLLQEVKNMKWRKKSFSLYFFLNKKETQFKKKWTEDLDIKFPMEGMRMATGTWKDEQHHQSSETCTLKPQWNIIVHTCHNSCYQKIRKKMLMRMWRKKLTLLYCWWAFQVVLVVKILPTNARDIRDVNSIPQWGRSPLEEGMATHSSILGWRI